MKLLFFFSVLFRWWAAAVMWYGLEFSKLNAHLNSIMKNDNSEWMKKKSIRTHACRDACFHNWCTCTSITRRWIAVIDYNQFVPFGRECSFLFILLRTNENENRRDATNEDIKKSERDFIESNEININQVFKLKVSCCFAVISMLLDCDHVCFCGN